MKSNVVKSVHCSAISGQLPNYQDRGMLCTCLLMELPDSVALAMWHFAEAKFVVSHLLRSARLIYIRLDGTFSMKYLGSAYLMKGRNRDA
jgi:hypothetical protein